jgi:hypothetical protein
VFLGALLALTAVTNFLCLAISLWLGFYIVTRSPNSKVSWLASATLWSLSGYFLNNLTYIQGPPGSPLPRWWGWSVALAIPFCFHLSVALLPEGMSGRRRPLVYLFYFLTVNFVAMEAYTPWVFSGATAEPSIYSSAQRAGPLYPFFALYHIAVPALALYNLWLGRRQAKSGLLRKQFALLGWTVALAIFSGLYNAVSVWFALGTPTLISSLSLGAGVVLLGYAVARYNALVEGRAIGIDFLYTALAMVLVVGAYLVAAFLSDLIFGVPFIAFVLVIMLAIVSHSLYDWGRTFLDRLFYRRQHRELRANLRDFVRRATPDQDIQESLQAILQTLCDSLEARKGLVALREGEGIVVAADWQVDLGAMSVASEALVVDEVTVLSAPTEHAVLAGMALIVPLFAAGEQMGAIVLGHRTTGVQYAEEDLELLEDCADTVAAVVQTMHLQERSVEQIDALLRQVRRQEQELQARMREALAAGSGPAILDAHSETEAISLVEDALRHLYDYPYLGEHVLAQLRVVESYLDLQEGAFVTHLDRGQALQEALVAAIEKLKPPGPQPSLPAREWRHYVILHDAYVLGELNRDIMSRLYIGEGTFHRARRRAVRAVARAVAEMERQAEQNTPA